MKKGLKGYAKLIAKVGGAVKKGDEVWIMAGLDQPEFVLMVMEECYKCGAKYVNIEWMHQGTSKISSIYMKEEDMAQIPDYRIAKFDYQSKHFPTRIYIESEDPDGMKGADQEKLANVRMKQYPIIKPYIDAMEDKYKWCIAAVPGVEWARKVFPGVSDKKAVNLLWDAILKASRAAKGNPCKNWKEHNETLAAQCKKLNDLHIDYLTYKAGNGTDFKVWLMEDSIFLGGGEYTLTKKYFNPNIPSEECFTSPMKGKCEGRLVATKPLSYQGQLIDKFYIDFKDGKVSNVHAEVGQEMLEKMVKMDEGASMLGECALIPVDSPISNLGVLFFNTLFDENAACHFALGRGFGTCVRDNAKYTQKELQDKGLNSSMIHVDFMIGCKDLQITAHTRDGKDVKIFVDGNWAI